MPCSHAKATIQSPYLLDCLNKHSCDMYDLHDSSHATYIRFPLARPTKKEKGLCSKHSKAAFCARLSVRLKDATTKALMIEAHLQLPKAQTARQEGK